MPNSHNTLAPDEQNVHIDIPAYNSSPVDLLWFDLKLLFRNILYLPGIVLPLKPSAPLDELYPSVANLWAIFLQPLSLVFQLFFISTLFLWPITTVFMTVVLMAGFLGTNYWIFTAGVNGEKRFFKSDVDLSQFPKHENEQWLFVNGVVVGRHWFRANVNKLAKTFGREVLGVHNPTYGILMDLIQCILERDFSYLTQDIRDGYVLVKKALQDTKYDKVVLILHSQGGIEGGLMIDMLLADLGDDLLCKLEIYTFASFANHFNNPLRLCAEGKRPVFRHVEHYANTNDYVSRCGVLSFAKSPTHIGNRFAGTLFTREGSGHMFNQHYLATMFEEDPVTGLVAETNDFMETVVERETTIERKNTAEIDHQLEYALDVVDGSTPLDQVPPNFTRRGRRVKDLSQLWKYRNGRSDSPLPNGLAEKK
jgi:hypothetical protein